MTRPHAVIFYGGFLSRTAGAFMHARTLRAELERMGWGVSIVTLDSLPRLLRYIPHLVERAVNMINAPLGFHYKGRITGFLFRTFCNRPADLRVFEDIYLTWNSASPAVTVLHALWSDNLQALELPGSAIAKLIRREAKRLSEIQHPVVTVSEPYRDYILQTHFAACRPRKSVDVVELGVDMARFLRQNSRRLPKAIIYCGTLEARKNVSFLLNVFEKVSSQDASARLTIVGDGPQRQELEASARERRLPVRFTGRLNPDEVLEQLQAHSIFVHTSVKESFSFALLEAKLSGLTTCALASLEVPACFIDVGMARFDADLWAAAILRIPGPHSLDGFPDFSAERMARRTLALAGVSPGGEQVSTLVVAPPRPQ